MAVYGSILALKEMPQDAQIVVKYRDEEGVDCKMMSLNKKMLHVERTRRVKIINERYGISLVIPEVRIPTGEDEEEFVDSLVDKILPPEYADDAQWFFIFGKAGRCALFE